MNKLHRGFENYYDSRMTTSFILFLALGAAAGGFINGLAGTGTAFFSLPFYLVIMAPVHAIAIASLLAILAGFQGLWVIRANLKQNKSKLAAFIIPGIIGVPIGVALLESIDANNLRILIAVLLIVYGGYFAFRPTLPSIEKPTPIVDVFISFSGGLLAGLAALSGALPMMWLSMRPWSKSEIRAILQPFNMTVLTATTTMLLFKGAYDDATLSALMIAIPVAICASLVGLFLFTRLSNAVFRRLLKTRCLLAGLGILLQVMR